MKKQYRAIIFDLDNTLIDMRTAYRKTFEKFARRYPERFESGNAAQEKDLFSFSRRAKREARKEKFLQVAEKWHFGDLDYETLWAEWWPTYTHSATAFPWSEDVLRELRKRGYRLGLLTNGNPASQQAKLDTVGMEPLFDDVMISGAFGCQKPDPMLFRLSAERLGVSVSECLFVGDTARTDIDGALMCGMDCVWISRKRNTVHATYAFPDVRGLLTILDGVDTSE